MEVGDWPTAAASVAQLIGSNRCEPDGPQRDVSKRLGLAFLAGRATGSYRP